MKRYDLIEVGYPLTGVIEEVPDGEYVKYADAKALHEALKRMVGACEHYLESQIESESNMYDPKYIGPLEQARKALRGGE